MMLASALLSPACAQHLQQPASLTLQPFRCRLPVVKLTANEFDNPDEGAGRTYRNIRDRGASLISTFEKSVGSGVDKSEPEHVLVLSGGSLHGAFGAGFFYGWANSGVPGDDKLPTYKIVTGVSTGALQSTFVFLATSPISSVQEGAANDAAGLRDIAFLWRRKNATTNGVAPPGSSYLANLAQDYMPDAESDLLHLRPLQRRSPNKIGMLELIANPSLATMEPLRQVIAAEIGDKTLEGIAAEATDRDRKLFVAVADLANGYGYAADLTRLAQLAVNPAVTKEDLADRALVFPGSASKEDRMIAARRCYVDALVASSSVPPGVPEVSIGIIRIKRDGHLANPDPDPNDPKPEIATDRAAANHAFIDGGAAFAVFFSQMKDQLAGLNDVDMDLIVNGSYYPQKWDKWENTIGDDPKNWNIKLASSDVMLQSAELLQTQVRLFSVQDARRWAKGRGRFRWAFIDNREIVPKNGVDDMIPWDGDFVGTPLAWNYTNDKGVQMDCGNWRDNDRQRLNPMEFFPTYMRCVLAYGRARGRDPVHRWNLIEMSQPRRAATKNR
jgi:predicted acylesterase/phospholipase RssA